MQDLSGNNDGTLKMKIYRSMLNDILEGRYIPERPFTEKELTEKYQISKSPIREALIQLCNEGILRSIPRYGYEVLRIKEKEVKDAKEARLLIECGALEKYFDRLTGERIAYLRNILESDHQDSEDIQMHWDRNSSFHIALMESYGNGYLVSVLTRSMILMKRAYAQYQYNRWQKLGFSSQGTRHRELLYHVQSGEKELAIKTLAEDIESFDTSFLD